MTTTKTAKTTKTAAAATKTARADYKVYAPMTEKKAKQILTLAFRKGMTRQAIADKVGVTRGCVGHVLAGRTWSHIVLK